MKRWRCLMCRVVTAFDRKIDPNAMNLPCPACQLSGFGWEEA